ncbi:hypothetical protein I2I05_14675 [Hymenobacter sp. BT683]|uniref:Periplasmic heavy metal sensor n=1 Tax=Hymenobacter jeongseonensis TaxID=2791027 RepID=A0ABS0IJX3_9BACT|nr:hypothetical protein [Hymenobacter jeongseonensis]MBF9238646.1 hypothetical protein [Hymenobacter jeongseonensis]
MRSASFSVLLLTSVLTLGSCSLFRPRAKTPVIETVRTEDSPTPKTAARDLADVMTTELQLTPDQTQKVRTILNGTVEQANAAKLKYAPKSPELLAELKRINISSQKELQVVLGPTKFKQLQANQRKMAAEMQQRQK